MSGIVHLFSRSSASLRGVAAYRPYIQEIEALVSELVAVERDLWRLMVLDRSVPWEDLGKAASALLRKGPRRKLWRQRRDLGDHIIQVGHKLLEEVEKGEDFQNATCVISDLIRAYEQARWTLIAIKEPGKAQIGSSTAVGRATKDEVESLLALSERKFQAAVELVRQNDQEETVSRAIQIALDAIIDSAKIRLKRADQRQIVERMANELSRFTAEAIPHLRKAKAVSLNAAMREAVKVVVYGILATGLFETVKMWSGMNPAVFESKYRTMRMAARRTIAESNVISGLLQQGLDPSLAETIVEVLYDKIEYHGIYDSDFRMDVSWLDHDDHHILDVAHERGPAGGSGGMCGYGCGAFGSWGRRTESGNVAVIHRRRGVG